MIDLILADAVKWAEDYRGDLFHALLCDAPYELGFMGKHWDKSGVAFKPETWAAFARILHDGAFGMAFASARGWHRMACAIEDAGFVIHPTIFGWSYGSGFPKATRIDTQVDKAAGAERIDAIKGGHRGISKTGGDAPTNSADEFGRIIPHIIGRGAISGGTPQTDLARTWTSHRYGLQALKPALEPIIVFQKPYRGKPVDCITRTGAGALWIDGARIGTESVNSHSSSDLGGNGIYGHSKPRTSGDYREGRWASNFILTCSPSCNGTHAPDCVCRKLDAQSGILKSGARTGTNPNATHALADAYDGGWKQTGGACEASTGGASRFFFRAQYDALEAADPVRYVAKASRRERDAGLDRIEKTRKGGCRPNEPETGYADNDLSARLHDSVPQRNPHPTVKPIALARYLATLLLPPAEYAPRRIFVPFAGVASEMIGAMQAGWDEISGVEQEQEYTEIGKARIEYWQGVKAKYNKAQLTMELA